MYPASVEYLNRQQMFPKLRQWTLGKTVHLGFALCDWFLSDFYVYLSLVLVLVIIGWFVYWFGCSLLFDLFIYIYYYSVSFFFFLPFFSPFLLSRVADRVLVLWPGVRPEPPRWESWVEDIGPPETSWPHVISIGHSAPRDLCLSTKTQLHQTASKLQW